MLYQLDLNVRIRLKLYTCSVMKNDNTPVKVCVCQLFHECSFIGTKLDCKQMLKGSILRFRI